MCASTALCLGANVVQSMWPKAFSVWDSDVYTSPSDVRGGATPSHCYNTRQAHSIGPHDMKVVGNLLWSVRSTNVPIQSCLSHPNPVVGSAHAPTHNQGMSGLPTNRGLISAT